MSCRKRRFASRREARRACSKLGARVRTYWCRRCGAWHVANADKEPKFAPPDAVQTDATNQGMTT